MSDEANIHRGLDGVVVDTTRISKVMPEINSLVYAGYPVQELCEHCHFEEVAWLMWHGELPTAKELAAFMANGRAQREISQDLLFVIQKSPRTAHPMDVLRTAVSFLGSEDAELDKTDAATNLKRSISMMAKIPTMIAAFYRLRKGQDFIADRKSVV
jgi:citrate synthase